MMASPRRRSSSANEREATEELVAASAVVADVVGDDLSTAEEGTNEQNVRTITIAALQRRKNRKRQGICRDPSSRSSSLVEIAIASRKIIVSALNLSS